MNETKVKELWKILENKYTWLGGLAKKVSMTRSVENQLHLKKKKISFIYRQGTSMSKHLNYYNKTTC